MKTIQNLSLVILAAITFGCSEDDEIPPGEIQQYTLIKIDKEIKIFENQGPQEVIISFFNKAVSDGEFKLSLHTEDEINIETIPEMVNGVISFKVEKGDFTSILTVIPKDDERINGYHTYSFSLTSLSENFRRANERNLDIGLYDDELNGMPKSLNITSPYTSTSYEYYYNSDKKLQQTIKKYVDYGAGWIETTKFYYSSDSKLIKTKNSIKFNDSEMKQEHEIVYLWENDLVTQTEYMVGDRKQYYTVYQYNEDQNISSKEEYYLPSPDDEPILVSRSSYNYNSNKDLIENYITTFFDPNEWDYSEEETVRKITYGDYIEYSGAFPFNELIPGLVFQKNLPGVMSIQTDNNPVETYDYTYEFEGEKLIKRISTQETAFFEYQ